MGGEAVKDRRQLAGSLVLDEHTQGKVGGELTMRQEAGGLKVHEEVALGLDEVDAALTVTEEVASDVAT